MVFKSAFINFSLLSWRSDLLVEKIGVPGETHRPAGSDSLWQTLSHNVASCTPRLSRVWKTKERDLCKEYMVLKYVCMSNVLLIIRSTYCYKSVLHVAWMGLNIILREFSTCIFRQIWAISYRFSMYNGSKYTHFELVLFSLDSLWNSFLHFSNRLCELVMTLTFTLQ